jgi:F-type H+-transporting ATPase subunit a
MSGMKTKTKVFIGLGTYLAIAIALLLIFGNDGKNEEFKPQNEFKLPAWVHIKLGPIDLSINRAVLYLALASVLTIITMTYIAKRMTQKPNRVQTSAKTSPNAGSPSSPPSSSSSGSPT